MTTTNLHTDPEELRAYLCSFWEEFDYQPADAEHLLGVYDRLAADPEIYGCLERIFQIYTEDYLCGFDEIAALSQRMAQRLGAHEYTVDLLAFTCLTKRLRELYAEKGIDLKYFKNSMADLKYKLEECRLVYGIVGSFVAGWFVGFFRLTRFGIGRLQFEVVPFGAHYERHGVALTPNTKALNVHIPRSKEPLTEAACLAAYREAKEFFKAEVPTDPCPFVCDSYLLYPDNELFLPKDTNTYRFFKSFDILSSRPDRDRNNLWRLFDTMERNVDRLPADTSLRRAFVAHLKNGGKMGEGRGVLLV